MDVKHGRDLDFMLAVVQSRVLLEVDEDSHRISLNAKTEHD